jgi:hypothetical protein
VVRWEYLRLFPYLEGQDWWFDFDGNRYRN